MDGQSQPPRRTALAPLLILSAVGALPAALAAGAVEFLSHDDSSRSILIAFLSVAPFALLLPSIAHLFFAVKPPFQWLRYLAIPVLPILGVFVGFMYVPLTDQLPRGNWFQLEPPPALPQRFLPESQLSIFEGTIYVEAEDGLTYAFDCVTYQGCEWRPGSPEPPGDPNEPRPGVCPPGGTPQAHIEPPAPGPIADKLIIISCGPDFTIEQHFLISRSRSIYGWARYDGMGIIFAVIAFSLAGLVSGTALTVAAAILYRRPARRNPAAGLPIPA